MDRNYFGLTDTGKVRSNNEDTFIAEKISGTDFVLACVIDGVGGYTGGEVAAAIARKTILDLMDMPEGDTSLALAHYQAGFQPLLYGIVVALILTFFLRETGMATRKA